MTTTTTAVSHATPEPRRDRLTIDIWFMVFKEVINSNPSGSKDLRRSQVAQLKTWLLSMRTVSKDFRHIVTLFAFSTFDFRNDLRLEPVLKAQNVFLTAFSRDMWQHLVNLQFQIRYTQNNIHAMAFFLERCPKLKEYRLGRGMYGGETLIGNIVALQCLPSQPNHQGSYKFVEDEVWSGVSIEYDDSLDSPRKSRRLRELADGTPEKDSSLSAYRTVYGSSQGKLPIDHSDANTQQVLRRSDIGVGAADEDDSKPVSRFSMHFNYPTMKKLKLDGGQFVNPESKTNRLWDMSSVYSLTIKDKSWVVGVAMTELFPSSHLSRLRTIKLVIGYLGREEGAIEDLRDWLTSLFRGCKDLSSVKFTNTYWEYIVDIGELLKIGPSLHKLRITGE
ncbi:hypothetical protein VTL71DRAFT_4717 [Oculimacula yallundae]|uniref:Uncharacterized protein n=1 Tax=Oculimacula yallundae TaxID=86028 RepID=A0ABR4C558_9HELO